MSISLRTLFFLPALIASLSFPFNLPAAHAAEKPEFFVQLGHSSTVMSMAFSPDGKYAVSGSMDNNVKLWDIVAGRELRTLGGHTDYIKAVAVSRDGRYAASASHDQTVRVWEIETGREVRRLGDLFSESLSFLADGSLLIGDSIGKVRIWNFRSGTEKELKKPDFQGDITAVSLQHDGRTIVTATKRGFKVTDVQTGQVLKKFAERKGDYLGDAAAAFSEDGRYALFSFSSRISMWDVEAGKEIRAFEGHNSRVNSVAFSPDGKYVLSGAGDYSTVLWDAADGRMLRSVYFYKRYVYGARGGVTSVAFSPDGRHVLAGHAWGGIKLYNIMKDDVVVGGFQRGSAAQKAGLAAQDAIISLGGKEISSWGDFEETAGANPGRELEIKVVRGGRTVDLKITPAAVKVKDGNGRESTVGRTGVFKGAKIVHDLESSKDNIRSASLSGDARYGVTSSENGRMCLWDIKTGRQAHSFKPYGNVFSTLFSAKGHILTAGEENVSLWEAGKDKPLSSVKQDSISMFDRALAFSPDGRYALAGGKGKVILFDAEDMREIRTILFAQGVPNSVSALAVSPDSGSLAAGYSMKVNLWEMETGRLMATLQPGSFVYAVDYAPGGRQIVSGAQQYGQANTIKLWDATTGRLIRHFGNYKRSVYDMRFSGDGRTLLTGGDELLLWDVSRGMVKRNFVGHQDTIYAVGFLAGGRQIVSAGYDGTMRLWNVDTGREIAQFISFSDGEWIVITPGGYYNASPKGDGPLNVRVGNSVYGIENYREAFFRPDLVKVALGGGSLKEFRNLADVKRAPTVSIVDTPRSVDRDEVSITIRIADNGGGLGDIRIYVNGSAVLLDNGRAVKITAKGDRAVLKNYTIKLAKGINAVRAVAFNGDNTMQSNEALHEVEAKFVSAAKPSLYALVIGINEFKNPKLKLNYPAADADLFAGTLKDAAAGLFEKTAIRKLSAREETTSEAVLAALKSFQALKPDDLFVFYIASHGTVDEGEYFLITSNVGSLRTEKLRTDAISQNRLKEAISNIPATKKLIIIDTCNAGALGEAIQVAMLTRGMSEDTALKILSRAVGSTILSASTSMQEALEGYKGHGLFTYVLAEGLKGRADKGGTGYIKTTELADYVDSEVPVLAEKVFKRAQYPTVSISGQSFPIGKSGN